MDETLKKLFGYYYAGQGGYLSGEEIGDELGISRAAVWKKIENLKDRGYVVDSVQKKGYRLISVPENRMIPEAVAAELEILRGGKRLPPEKFVYLPKVDSTNSYAKRMAADAAGESFVVFSDEQVSGRGRLKRVWNALAGKDLAATFCIPLDCEISEYFRYSIVLASAVHRMLSAYAEGFSIKWPNDIYHGGKKICGILCETVTEQNRIVSLIAGVGINVNSESALTSAVSLLDITGKLTDRNRLLAELADAIFAVKEEAEKDYESVYRYWKTRLAGLNRSVRFETGRETLEGILTDVGPDGSVEIDKDGKKVRYYSGDLYVL